MFINPYLANVTMFAGNFAPRGWMFCQGQLLAIAQNDALFALIGTTYGGDGITTFALPDFRGRKAVHPGTGAGLSTIVLGQVSGTPSVTMAPGNVPIHTHTVVNIALTPQGSSVAGTQNTPNNNYPAPKPGTNAFSTASSGTVLGTATSSANTPASPAGGVPIDITQPYLAVNFIIAVEGIFPSRN
jgi:microcystin-dependent protein